MINDSIGSLDKHTHLPAKSQSGTRAIRAPFSAARRMADHRFAQCKINPVDDIATAKSIEEAIACFINEQPSQLYRGGA
jgi:hypothetical protein